MQPDRSELCDEIRGHHRRRVFAMEQRKRADLAIGAFLRTQLGWRLDLPKPEQKAIAERAKALVVAGERVVAGKKPDLPNGYAEWAEVIEMSLAARAPFDQVEAKATKEMKRLAQQLSAWETFGVDVRGFGELSLAVIVGEAGDLSLYGSHSKLWKRMGLAVMGRGDGLSDRRQGGLAKGAPKGDWIAHGYNANRRSRMFVIGDSMFKTGPYRQVYLARKAYEIAQAQAEGLTVAPSAKIPEKRKAEFRSDGHVHRRAQRYMEKRLLRDLWRAWRGGGQATTADEATLTVPSPDEIREAAAMLPLPPAAIAALPPPRETQVAA